MWREFASNARNEGIGVTQEVPLHNAVGLPFLVRALRADATRAVEPPVMEPEPDHRTTRCRCITSCARACTLPDAPADVGCAACNRQIKIMRVALLSGGVASWSFAYSAVDEPRTFENLCDRELAVNKTGPTRWNTLEVVERTERRFEVKVTRCLYHELTTSLGVPELTPIVCQIDNAGFNSYLPDEVLFHRGGVGRRIADGASECNFIWERAPRPR